MVAFKASRLVCPAMVLINSTTSPMRAAAFDNSPTRSLVARACSTASPAIRADSCTWRLISLTDDAISSVAEATDCTLVEASSDAAATMEVISCARSAVDVNVPAEVSSSIEADDTVSTIWPTAPSNSSARQPIHHRDAGLQGTHDRVTRHKVAHQHCECADRQSRINDRPKRAAGRLQKFHLLHSDIENAEHLPIRIEDRIIGSYIGFAEDLDLAAKRSLAIEDRIICTARRQACPYCPRAIRIHDIGRYPQVLHEHGAGAADEALDLVDQFRVTVQDMIARQQLAVHHAETLAVSAENVPRNPHVGFHPFGGRFDRRAFQKIPGDARHADAQQNNAGNRQGHDPWREPESDTATRGPGRPGENRRIRRHFRISKRA